MCTWHVLLLSVPFAFAIMTPTKNFSQIAQRMMDIVKENQTR
nr:unnamed protein product [Callosobruchus chinensis]